MDGREKNASEYRQGRTLNDFPIAFFEAIDLLFVCVVFMIAVVVVCGGGSSGSGAYSVGQNENNKNNNN